MIITVRLFRLISAHRLMRNLGSSRFIGTQVRVYNITVSAFSQCMMNQLSSFPYLEMSVP